MVGHAVDFNLEHRPSGDAGNDADGSVGMVEGRPLFDVKLEERGQLTLGPSGLPDTGHVAADVGEATAQTDAVIVHGVQVLIQQHSRHGPASQQPAVEAGALLVGEDHRLYGMPQPAVVVGQRLDTLQCRQHTQRAVVLPSAWDRVGMRSHANCRQARLRPFQATNYVPCRVYAGLHPGFPHQRNDVVPSGNILRRESHPLHTQRGLANGAQFLDCAVQPGRVDVQLHRVNGTSSLKWVNCPRYWAKNAGWRTPPGTRPRLATRGSR